MWRICLLIFSCLFTGFLPAQQYNFRNFSVADGLGQSQVYAICEDSRGYLWLGTRGGDIWIGTDEGVCVFNGLNFTEVKLPGSRHNVKTIVCAKDGRTWIGTDDTGLFILDGEKIILHREGNILPSKKINCLYEDTDGSMWVGTPLGAVCFKPNGSTELFNKQDGLLATDVWAVSRDGKNRLWFATYGSGLFRKYQTGGFERFNQDHGLTNNTVHCMQTDQFGRLWVGTASGVTRIDGETVTNFTEKEGLCSDAVMSVAVDSWGNMWFGTSGGGACRLDGERFIHFNEKSGDMGAWVYAVHCDVKGHMWFASSRGGVTEYDGMYYTNYYEGAGFTSAKVKCIGQDTTGTMWFGTSGDGVYSFYEGSFKHYTTRDGASSNHFHCFLTDSLNRTWMGTAGGYISIYDPLTQKFIKVRKQ